MQKNKVKNRILTILAAVLTAISLFTCMSCKKEEYDGAYDFIIYESDTDNTNLSDNKIVARYHIEYKDKSTVTDTLIKKDGNKYYFTNDSSDYLVLENGAYGLYYTNGYFNNYSECLNNKEIDVSWSSTTVNGTGATTSIGETPLEGLEEFGFIINGWK